MTVDDDIPAFEVKPTPEWQDMMRAINRWVDSLPGEPSYFDVAPMIETLVRAMSLADQNCDGEKGQAGHALLKEPLYPHRLVEFPDGGEGTYFKCVICGRINTNGIPPS